MCAILYLLLSKTKVSQLDQEEIDTLDSLLPPSASARKTLADLIFSKLDASEHVRGVDQATVVSDPLPSTSRSGGLLFVYSLSSPLLSPPKSV
jgi:hypothetical protein